MWRALELGLNNGEEPFTAVSLAVLLNAMNFWGTNFLQTILLQRLPAPRHVRTVDLDQAGCAIRV